MLVFDYLPQSVVDAAVAAIDPVKTLALYTLMDERTFRKAFRFAYERIYRTDLLYGMVKEIGLGEEDVGVDLPWLGRSVVAMKAASLRGIAPSVSVARKVRAEMRVMRAELDAGMAGKLIRMDR